MGCGQSKTKQGASRPSEDLRPSLNKESAKQVQGDDKHRVEKNNVEKTLPRCDPVQPPAALKVVASQPEVSQSKASILGEDALIQTTWKPFHVDLDSAQKSLMVLLNDCVSNVELTVYSSTCVKLMWMKFIDMLVHAGLSADNASSLPPIYEDLGHRNVLCRV